MSSSRMRTRPTRALDQFPPNMALQGAIVAMKANEIFDEPISIARTESVGRRTPAATYPPFEGRAHCRRAGCTRRTAGSSPGGRRRAAHLTRTAQAGKTNRCRSRPRVRDVFMSERAPQRARQCMLRAPPRKYVAPVRKATSIAGRQATGTPKIQYVIHVHTECHHDTGVSAGANLSMLGPRLPTTKRRRESLFYVLVSRRLRFSRVF
jgi:hypothetical protein